MILTDTSAWFAASTARDINHAAARRWLAANAERLITTDYIVDETLTLLRARGESQRALELGEALFGGDLADIHYMTPNEIAAAWEVFRHYADKGWSFTDCTSYVVIGTLGITTAFAFDQHFRQFGNVRVVPPETP